jgi:hypothetical protein
LDLVLGLVLGWALVLTLDLAARLAVTARFAAALTDVRLPRLAGAVARFAFFIACLLTDGVTCKRMDMPSIAEFARARNQPNVATATN